MNSMSGVNTPTGREGTSISCWGRNGSGQLGDGNISALLSLVPVRATIAL